MRNPCVILCTPVHKYETVCEAWEDSRKSCLPVFRLVFTGIWGRLLSSPIWASNPALLTLVVPYFLSWCALTILYFFAPCSMWKTTVNSHCLTCHIVCCWLDQFSSMCLSEFIWTVLFPFSLFWINSLFGFFYEAAVYQCKTLSLAVKCVMCSLSTVSLAVRVS